VIEDNISKTLQKFKWVNPKKGNFNKKTKDIERLKKTTSDI